MAEREKYRLDSIYTILEKSLYPVKFPALAEKYANMIAYWAEYQASTGWCMTPFYQVQYLLNSLNVHDLIVFKKTYDVYIDAILQICPEPIHHAQKALQELKDRGKKIGLISNTGKTPGVILRMMLKEINLFDYFDDMVFSDEAGYLKPDERIFHLAADRLGVKRDETIFIGDLKVSDYDGAMGAGLGAHLFNRTKEDLYNIIIGYSGGY
jgi:putative hydrolase of the HAD superfamily